MTLFRLCFAIAIGLFALFAAPDAFAQANRNGDDQPGLVANPDDEQLDPKWQKTVVFYRTTEPPGTIIVPDNERYLYVVQPGGRALRYGIGVGRDGFQWQGLVKITQQKGMAGLDAAAGNDRAPALSAALDGGRARQSARRPRDVSRHHGLSHSRHQPAADHRHRGVVGLLPPDQSGCDRSLRSDPGRHQGDHPAAA